MRNENSYDVLECKSDHDLQKSESASFQRSKDIQKNKKRKKRTKNRTWIDALRFIHAFVYLIQLSKLTGSRLTNCLGNRASLDKQNIFFLIVHYFSKAYIFWILFILFSTEIQRCSQAILFINLYLYRSYKYVKKPYTGSRTISFSAFRSFQVDNYWGFSERVQM